MAQIRGFKDVTGGDIRLNGHIVVSQGALWGPDCQPVTMQYVLYCWYHSFL